MSKVTMTQCEICKKRVDDPYAVKGWITLGTMGTISIAKGRGKDGSAKSHYFNGVQGQLDFCSRKCFIVWLDKLP